MKKIITIVSLIIVVGGLYFYINGRTTVSTDISNQEKFEKAVAKRKQEEILNPPSGYLIPKNIPPGYKIQDNGSRFTSYSTSFSYTLEHETQFGNMKTYLNFSETAQDTAEDWIKREIESPEQSLRVVKDFTYNQNKGVVIGAFGNENQYKQFPLNSSEKYLIYNHNGRLVRIHTTDSNISVDILIKLLKDATISP